MYENIENFSSQAITSFIPIFGHIRFAWWEETNFLRSVVAKKTSICAAQNWG
jgi:hypothetical protein